MGQKPEDRRVPFARAMGQEDPGRIDVERLRERSPNRSGID